MTIEREVTVDGQTYPVIISDENEALQAAKAAGRAIVGLWREKSDINYSDCLYLITDPDDVSDAFLERVIRRHLDLPWIIAKTDHLIIREFASDDPLEQPSEDDADSTFSDNEKREEYRRHQYRFSECGLWALVRREDGILIGKAGLTDGELGYHIYKPYRRQGYALEACHEIIKYGFEALELNEIRLITKTSNMASIALAEKMGFIKAEQSVSSLHSLQSRQSPQSSSTLNDAIVFCMQKGYNGLYTKK